MQLLPAAEAVVARLNPVRGEHIADVGCGTGNAALLAAAQGAIVTAIDPSSRLLRVAQERARSGGLEIETVWGLADAIPKPDAAFDGIVSVFGVIFAPDARAAAAELARTLKRDGRMVLCAWVPGGPIGAQAEVRADAVALALGGDPGPGPFAWHDLSALEALFGPLGYAVTVDEATLALKARNASEYIDQEFRLHPMWVEARSILEPIGKWSETAERATRILEDANEDRDTFCVTSRYVIASVSSGGQL
jgi:SAM-dependent methyltransferase